MKLKSVVFYQGVKLWDGNLYATVQSGDVNGRMKGVSIDLVDHIVTVSKEGEGTAIVVGTANMRNGVVDVETTEHITVYPLPVGASEKIQEMSKSAKIDSVNYLIEEGLINLTKEEVDELTKVSTIVHPLEIEPEIKGTSIVKKKENTQTSLDSLKKKSTSVASHSRSKK